MKTPKISKMSMPKVQQKHYSQLGVEAQRILETMRSSEGYFIKLSAVREKAIGIDELLDNGIITYASLHEVNGYKLTKSGLAGTGLLEEL